MHHLSARLKLDTVFNSIRVALYYPTFYITMIVFNSVQILSYIAFLLFPLSIHPSYASGQMRVLCKCELLPLSQINTQHPPILIHLPQLIFNGYPDSRKPKLSEKTQKKKKLTAVTYKSTYIMQLK